MSFKADEIEGYKVKGKSRFLSAVVEMNLASIGEPNKILDTIFVEVLVSGKANLFRYHDNSKDHFFIGKDTISMQELIFSHQEGGEADSTEKFAFKKQLSQSLADCEAAVNLVQTTSFNANELMALFHMYNTCFGKQD